MASRRARGTSIARDVEREFAQVARSTAPGTRRPLYLTIVKLSRLALACCRALFVAVISSAYPVERYALHPAGADLSIRGDLTPWGTKKVTSTTTGVVPRFSVLEGSDPRLIAACPAGIWRT